MIGFTQGSISTFLSRGGPPPKTSSPQRRLLQVGISSAQLQALYGCLLVPVHPLRLEPPLPGLQETAPGEGVDPSCLARTFMKSVQGFVIPPGPCVSGRIVTEPLASTEAVVMARCQPAAAESHPDWSAFGSKNQRKRDKGQRSGGRWKYCGVIQYFQKPGFSHDCIISQGLLVLQAIHCSSLAPPPFLQSARLM